MKKTKPSRAENVANFKRRVHDAANLPSHPGVDCSNALNHTKQSFKESSDINNIMSKYLRTGVIDSTNRAVATYGDIPAIDFRQAMEVVVLAEAAFAELPSGARARFDNDPAKFLEFAENPDNLDEAVRLGLTDAPPASPAPEAPGPTSVEPLTPPPAPPEGS